MRGLSSFAEIFLYRDPVDFRTQIGGLAVIVESEMGEAPLGGALFGFCSRDRRKVKLLYWDRTGFALWQKRLEEARFPWPKAVQTTVVELRAQEMEWLLEGIEFWRMKPHETLNYACVS